MAIKPGKRNSAIDIYVDKENLKLSSIRDIIDSVSDPYSEIITDDYVVIDVHGIGGKGKTAFVKELEKNLDNKHPYVKIDTDKYTSRIMNEEDTLLELRNRLVSEYGFKFPLFDYRIVIQKSPNQIELTEKNSSFEESKKFGIQYLTKFIKPVIDIAANLYPPLALASAGLDFKEVIEEYKNNTKLDVDQKLKQEYLKFKQNDPDKFLEQLRYDFVIDFNYHINSDEFRESYGDVMTIIFDTFEDYKDLVMKRNWLFQFDEDNGEYGLCHMLENVCWIFCGRYDLKLETSDGWNKSNSLSFMAENFTQDESDYYLEEKLDRNNISLKQRYQNQDEYNTIKNEFFRLTNGDPLVSKLITNQLLLKNDEDLIKMISEINKDGSAYGDVVLRYAKYLDDNSSKSDLLKYMISIGAFNYNDLVNINSFFNLNLNLYEYDSLIDQLNDYGLISKTLDKNDKEIISIDKDIREYLLLSKYPSKHKLSGKNIIENNKKEQVLDYLSNKHEISGYLEEFYIQHIIFLASIVFTEDPTDRMNLIYSKYLGRYISYLYSIDDFEEAQRILLMIINSDNHSTLDETFLSEFITLILDVAFQHTPYLYSKEIEDLINENHELLSRPRLLSSLTEYYKKRSQYLEAYKVYTEIYDNSKLSIENVDGYLWILARLEKFNEMRDFLLRVSYLADKEDLDNHYMLIINMYIALYLAFTNQNSESIKIFEYVHNHLKEYPEEVDIDTKIQFLSAYAVSLNKMELYNESLEISNELLEFLSSLKNDIDNSSTRATVLNTISKSYNMLGDFENYEKALEESYRIRKENLDEDSDEMQMAQNNYADLLNKRGNYKEALELALKSYKTSLDIYGPNHQSVANSLATIGLSYYNLGDYKNSTEYLKKSYEIKLNNNKNEYNDEVFIHYANYVNSLILYNENKNLRENLTYTADIIRLIKTNEDLLKHNDTEVIDHIVNNTFIFIFKELEPILYSLSLDDVRTIFLALINSLHVDGMKLYLEIEYPNRDNSQILEKLISYVNINSINKLAEEYIDLIFNKKLNYIEYFFEMLIYSKDMGILHCLFSNTKFQGSPREFYYEQLREKYQIYTNSSIGRFETYYKAHTIINEILRELSNE